MCFLQNVQRFVAKKSDVHVVAECDQPQRVAQPRGNKPITFNKDVVDKYLQEVKNDQQRKKCVQVHVKTESPLYVLIFISRFDKKFVADVPQKGGDDTPHSYQVHKYDIQQKFYKSNKVDTKRDGETCGG